ncbi:LysR family transcriptional regulator [Paenibacillus sp. CC-CFT747]|nr:LysR family transcriptional regulator [Paenibacillus sp. CC-CFT747]
MVPDFPGSGPPGNFTQAAEDLHMTQPSVSYAVKQLEDSLGIKLYYRMSKGVRLTAEGRRCSIMWSVPSRSFRQGRRSFRP